MTHFVFKGRLPKAECVAALLFLTVIPSLAHAQGTAAPAMFSVMEIVVQFAHFGDAKTADECGLSQVDLAAVLNKTLQDDGVPAVSVAEAKPPIIGVARIDLIPEIFSLNSQGLDCTSWVLLTAASRNSIRIPPVGISRNVTIDYWHDGVLLSSSQTTHERTVSDALQKLAHNFAQQYKLDQPPSLPNQ